MSSLNDLVAASIPFLDEVKEMTPNAEMERWLNTKCGPSSDLYKSLADLIKAGVRDGWAANKEVAGKHYRRSRLHDPSPETHHFSITAVYMDSMDPAVFPDEDDEDVLQGEFHGHPYGELNLVVPLTEGAH